MTPVGVISREQYIGGQYIATESTPESEGSTPG